MDNMLAEMAAAPQPKMKKPVTKKKPVKKAKKSAVKKAKKPAFGKGMKT